MPKKKTPAEQRAELMRERDENNKKIAALEHKQEQIDHQITREKNMMSYLASKERKARNHRLIVKGGVIEHHAPGTKDFTEREFYELVENIVSLPEAQRMIAAAVEAHRSTTNG